MRATIILFLIGFSSLGLAQPIWVSRVPEGFENDFFTGRGASSTSLVEAEQAALLNAVSEAIQNKSITIQVNKSLHSVTRETTTDFYQADELVKEINIYGESQTLTGLKRVETYHENNRGLYEAWVLISFPKINPTEPPTTSSQIWRSFLLPGWGQIHTNQTWKGLFFTVATLSGVTGGVVFDQLSKDSKVKASGSRTQARRDFFNDETKNFNTISKIAFISAGVLYIWNVTDAITVKPDEWLYVDLKQEGNKWVAGITLKF